MLPERFVLHISGPPCSGKSTLESALAEQIPGMYMLAFDRLKWQLAGYDRARHGPLVDELLLGFYGVVCRKGIPVLLDFFFATEIEHAACKRMAENQGYAFIDIELKAPVEVLLERFRKRLVDAARTGIKVTVTSETDFLETVAKPFYVPPGTPVFDTSLVPIAQIVDQVTNEILPKSSSS